MTTSKELALAIIRASRGDPKRANEAASVIDAWKTSQGIDKLLKELREEKDARQRSPSIHGPSGEQSK